MLLLTRKTKLLKLILNVNNMSGRKNKKPQSVYKVNFFKKDDF